MVMALGRMERLRRDFLGSRVEVPKYLDIEA